MKDVIADQREPEEDIRVTFRQSHDRKRSDRLALTVDEASELLGISKWLGYEMVAQGRLPALRLGRRLVIPLSALERLLDSVD
jgi:excisionase family DNA binding protein